MIRSPQSSAFTLIELPAVRQSQRAAFTLIELPVVRKNKRNAFTLIELMISIAMVVILMLGITKVFSLTSQTAGATNQLSSFLRDSRAAQAVFYQDFSTAVSDGAPCMLLCSSRVSAFRNRADELGARDWAGNPIEANIRHIDLNGDNHEGDSGVPGEIVPTTATNNRSHRIDTFSFFSRQRLQRQTGGTQASVATNDPKQETPLIAPMTADEAWIWYGHLLLPDNNVNFSTSTLPGVGTFGSNPNNFYATQWILGREAILLKQATGGVINDRNNISQAFINAQPVGGLNSLTPLASFTAANAGGYKMNSSRFDLANTSISDYLSRLTTLANGPSFWWQSLFCYGKTDNILGRFQAVPFGGGKITALSLSQQAPILLQGCSQFIVEYAGDYLNQNAAGQVTDCYTNWDHTANSGAGGYVTGTTDGQIDFYVDPSGAKKVIWYGLPRDTSSRNFDRAADGKINRLDGDVVPLRDWWQASTNTLLPQTGQNAPFEKQVQLTLPPTGNTTVGYAATDGSGMNPAAQYTCAFGPTDRKPQMIRITMTLDDPSGTLPDGVTFQYVFTLP